MISGFMIVKDVLKSGYPFVEAIASALPICDEFLISDGYSADGTFEIVQRISKLNKKVKIYRHKWPATRKLEVLAEVTNSLRRECQYDYIFYVQANEIIHEESWKFIKALPEMRPEVHTFSFPYLQLVESYKWTEEFRLRFSRNLPGIIAIGDAWSLGPSRALTRSEVFKSLKNPRRFLRYLGRGVEWTFADNGSFYSRSIYLPKPIFRYWSLFPRNFLEKCLKHAEMFNLPEFHQVINVLRNLVDDPPSFWRTASDLFRAGPEGIKYPEGSEIVNKTDHPAIIQDFISNPVSETYYVREDVLDLIRRR